MNRLVGLALRNGWRRGVLGGSRPWLVAGRCRPRASGCIQTAGRRRGEGRVLRGAASRARRSVIAHEPSGREPAGTRRRPRSRPTMGGVKVLLRNPRRELDMAGPVRVHALLDRLGVNRESVLVIVGDTLVTGDAVLDDADQVEIRPVISGGAR